MMRVLIAVCLLLSAALCQAAEPDLTPRSVTQPYDADGKYWKVIREDRPLTAEEREKMKALGQLPPAQAIMRLGYQLEEATNPEALQLARELFLQIPGWKEEMSARLAKEAEAKTPKQVYGAEFERRRMKQQLTEEEYAASAKCLIAVGLARPRQKELLYILSSLQTPEAVPIIAPYLFDTGEPTPPAGDPTSPPGADLVEFVYGALVALKVPDQPQWKYKMSMAALYDEWRKWWLAHARDYGADPNFRPAPLLPATPIPPLSPASKPSTEKNQSSVDGTPLPPNASQRELNPVWILFVLAALSLAGLFASVRHR